MMLLITTIIDILDKEIHPVLDYRGIRTYAHVYIHAEFNLIIFAPKRTEVFKNTPPE